MSTSVTKKYQKITLIYLIISIFCALFGAVYEHFSFGVYSYFMLYAFAFPLIGGALPSLIFSLLPLNGTPGQTGPWLYRCGIATLTMGSIIRGVLDIYGTTNGWIVWYWWVGGALCALGAMLYIKSMIGSNCN